MSLSEFTVRNDRLNGKKKRLNKYFLESRMDIPRKRFKVILPGQHIILPGNSPFTGPVAVVAAHFLGS